MKGGADQLHELLRHIDGRSYPAYRELRGAWSLGELSLGGLVLRLDHVQGDLVTVRRHEFAATINRHRGLRVCAATRDGGGS